MINTGHDINIFICVGNLPQDITIKTTPEGKRTIAFFSVGTCRRSKVKQDVSDFHKFIVKGELINSPILDKMKRGTKVHAEGVLTYSEGNAEIQCTSIRLV